MIIGYLLVLLSAVGFGFIPIFALYAYQSGVNVSTLLFLRFFIAALIFFIYAKVKLKKWTLSQKQIISMILLGGVFYTVQSLFYFLSVQYIPASLASLLVYLYPIFVAILSYFINRESFSFPLFASIALTLCGMAFILGSPDGTIQMTGILLAMGSALVYSLFIVIGNHVTQEIPSIITSAFITMSSALSFFIWGMASDTLHFHFQSTGWLAIIGVVLLSTVLAIFTLFAGMNIIGPTKASILSTVEPVVTAIFSFLLLDEKIGVAQIIGGCIVLAGASCVVILKEKQNSTKTVDTNCTEQYQ
ncbi:EamA family transporter [Niallia endozanthoxylica]|uniref:DMT family transporter n=1 Tax=Niallia endozanthoxylica TaxID=2036016 RepID=A0A5J5HZ07_9BACI|nr:DMT family transporter [Niallia endozanthoxylica]KAA9027766.1 DMT family transporter [Niallia endozanthoxylica]